MIEHALLLYLVPIQQAMRTSLYAMLSLVDALDVEHRRY